MAKITGQGLIAIACSVVLLWIFVIAERRLARGAYADRARVMRDIRLHRLRPHRQAAPIPVFSHRVRPDAG